MATNNLLNSAMPIEVAAGGTGRSSLTSHAVLSGSTTNAITQLTPGTNGQMLLGSSASDAAFATITSTGSSLTLTPGAASLNLDIVNYATGTFIPVLAFGGASVGITYSVQTASYVRISNLVFVTIAITLTSKGSSSGSMTLSTLPFPPAASCQLSFRGTNLTYLGEPIATINAGGGGTTLLIQRNASNSGVVTFTNLSFADNSAFNITGVYFV